MITEEILQLLKENNLMLRYICSYITKVEDPKNREKDDFKNFMTNLVADWYSDRVLGRGNNGNL